MTTTDPRAAIPDTVLPAPDGSQWLTRSSQLVIAAERNGAPRIVLDCEIIPVVRIDEQGRAVTLPNSTAIRTSRHYTLDQVPAELAAPLAAWMAAQAQPNGEALLATVYPPATEALP
jgi:hypothetical protein